VIGEGPLGGRWRPLQVALLAATPLALLATWVALLRVKGPFWLGTRSDPDYVYLLNGLNLSYGHLPGHVDHPGTPLQLLVAVVLRVTHLLTGSGSLADDVIRRPEHYLLVTNCLLLGLLAGALAVAGLAALQATGSLLAGLAAELLPGLASVVVVHATCVKPEPVLAAIAALVAAQTLRTLVPDRRPGRISEATAFGVLVGLAVATKVSAAPLAVLPPLLLEGRAARLRFAGVAAGTAALATLPAWPAMGIFRKFILGIATHSGQYGSGRPSLLDPGEYLRGLRLLIAEGSGGPTVAAMVAGCLVALALAWRARRDGSAATARARSALLATVSMQVISFLLVARHAASHYLVPAVVLSGLTVALAIHGVGLLAAQRPVLRQVCAAGLACLLGLACLRQVRELGVARAGLVAERDAQLAVVDALAERFPGARVLHFYRSSAPAFALHFGDMYAGARWSGQIQALHPRHLYYNVWNRRLEVFRPDPARPSAKPLEFRVLTRDVLCGTGGEGAVVIQGSRLRDVPATGADVAALRHRSEPAYSTAVEALYRPLGCPPDGSSSPR
jgi:hypothetical protein